MDESNRCFVEGVREREEFDGRRGCGQAAAGEWSYLARYLSVTERKYGVRGYVLQHK